VLYRKRAGEKRWCHEGAGGTLSIRPFEGSRVTAPWDLNGVFCAGNAHPTRKNANSPETGFWKVGMAEARNSNPEENQGPARMWAPKGEPVLERNFLLSALASRLVEGTLIFIDGIRGFRGFSVLRTVPVL